LKGTEMNEQEWADNFSRDLDTIMTGQTPAAESELPAEYRDALLLSRRLASVKPGEGAVAVRLAVRQRLLSRARSQQKFSSTFDWHNVVRSLNPAPDIGAPEGPTPVSRKLLPGGAVIFAVTMMALLAGLAFNVPDAIFSAGAQEHRPLVNFSGGFDSNPLDVSTFPEYVVATGSDAASGIAYPDYPWPDDDPCSMYEGSAGPRLAEFQQWDRIVLCIGIPVPPEELRVQSGAGEGVSFKIYLTSPGGQQYTVNALKLYLGPDGDIVRDLDDPVAPSSLRGGFPLYFPAGQEDGEWQVELKYDGGESQRTENEITFGSATINIATQQPIYSITRVADTPDPGSAPAYGIYRAGETLVFAGRGWLPSQTINLVLYTPDSARSDDINTVMIPVYAAQVMTDADGKFHMQFEIDENTPPGRYRVVFDPQPHLFEPEPLGFSVIVP
jgi:hypothetical protein